MGPWRLTVLFLALAFGLLSAGVWWTRDRALPLPASVVDVLERRANSYLEPAGLQIDVDGLALGWRGAFFPVLRAEGFRLEGAGGTDHASVGLMEAVLSRDAALRGRVVPAALRLEGATLTARRDGDGRLSLGFGGPRAALGGISGPGELIELLRGPLDAPGLAPLNEIGINRLSLTIADDRTGRQLTTRNGTLRLSRDGGALALSLDLGDVDGGALGATSGVVRGVLFSDAPGGAGRAAVVLRGLVPARLAGLAGAPALDDLLGRLDAPVSLDLGADVLETGAFGDVTGTLVVGDGTLAPPGTGSVLPFGEARAQLALRESGARLELRDVVLVSDVLTLSGQADLIASRGAGSDDILGQLRLADLTVRRSDLWPDPVSLDALTADLRYDRARGIVDIAAARIEREGLGLDLAGRLVPGPDGAEVAIDAALPRAGAADIFALWPRTHLKATRRWLERNVSAGELIDAHVAIRHRPGTRPIIGLSSRIRDARIRFARGLPPLNDVSGSLVIDGPSVILSAEDGALQPPQGPAVALVSGTVAVRDTRIPGGPLEVQFEADGTTEAALSVLALPVFAGPDPRPPPIAPDEAPGLVRLTGELAIPLRPGIRFADVDWTLGGAVSEVSTEALMAGRLVASDRLSIHADAEAVTLAGRATLDDLPFEMTFRRPLGRNRPDAGTASVDATLALTREIANAFGVPLAQGEMTGAGRAALRIDLARDAPPRVALTGDLSGVAFDLPQIGWRKARPSEGQLTLVGQLGPDARFETVTVDAPGMEARADLRLRPEGGLDLLDVSTLRVGDWLDIRAQVTQRPDRSVLIAVGGGTADLSAKPAGAHAGRPATHETILDLTLDRVRIGGDLALTDLRGRLSGGPRGTLRARVNDGPAVDVELQPGQAGPRMRVRAADAGAVMRAAGIFGMASGGRMDLRLIPQNGPGRYRGQLRITDTALRDTPAFAEVLSAISVVGAVEQLSGVGIPFDEVRADFRLAPDIVTIEQASAEGASLGVSLDGRVDLGRRRLDLQGVLSPVYFLNRIGSGMTRRGEGVIGVTFTLTGPTTRPRVGVNPFSALAPGAMREMFRRPAPLQRP